MRVDPSSLRFAGAVPLNPRPASPPGGAAAAAAAPAGVVIDVTEASFQADVLDRSMQVPVVLDLWATWCGPCKQLSPVLERLAAKGAGRWVLAKVDVDANPGISQALRVQSIPTVYGVVGGKLVPMFQGALPEAQVQAYLDQLFEVAAEQGISGRVGADDAEGGAAVPAGPQIDADLARGDDALELGDLAAARTAYAALLAREPANRDAIEALARVALMERTAAAPAADSDEVTRTGYAADMALLQGRVQAAIDVLVDLVRSTSGDDRERARLHLVSIFDALGPGAPEVAGGRRQLASALF